MNFKTLLKCAAFATLITVVGCKKSNTTMTTDTTGPNGTTGTTGSTGSTGTTGGTSPALYTITENFESGTKTGYAAGDVTLYTGSWNFNNALIGNLAADVKNGTQSVRSKTGDIHMNFDINGLKTLVIRHAKYGTDANSTWQLLMSTDGGASYTQVGTDIQESNTMLKTDSFKVSVTGKVRFEIKNTTANTSLRINFDDVTFIGTGDPGISVGVPDTAPVDTTKSTTAAAPRGVTVGADAPPASGDNSNLLLGNPSDALATLAANTNYLLNQGYYVESYNNVRDEPNWVSWHLDASNCTNATGRLDNFAPFNGLDPTWFAVQSNSYSGSGFDRGHNCPSADRTSSVDANSATFLMTNMIPQAPQNNQKTWANLENYLRDQVFAGNEVYIIMGSYGIGGIGSLGSTSNTIAGGKVTVPSNVWKIAVILPAGTGDIARITESTRVIAVNTPNINTINVDWKNYIVTVNDLETATGYKFFTALSTSLQTSLKAKRDPGN